MFRFLKNHWPIVVLVALTSVIAITNYTPGTILSGWDTLHPEFNFGLNLKRVLFGVFREEQGLGAVAAHAHMAELPRILLLFLFDLFLPMEMVRYAYIFLCLFLGPIGMYLFLKHGVFNPKVTARGDASGGPRAKWQTELSIQIPSFLGALFYLLNLGTLQQFILPFEMFTTLYATLPFLFLFTILFFHSVTKRQQRTSLLLFGITTLFAAPSAYAPTLWYIHFLLFSAFGISFVLLSPEKRVALKRFCLLLLLTLSINAFWWLPTLYFLFSHSQEVAHAYINQLFSPQAFLYNKEFGNPTDLALLKSFLFDWSMYDKTNGFIDVMEVWNQHLTKPYVLFIGFAGATVTLIGLLAACVKRNAILLALLPLLVIALFFLVNQNGPTGMLYAMLQENLPLLKEALRFPHTKFYLHYLFLFAVFFSIGQQFFFSLLTTVTRSHRVLPLILTMMMAGFLLFFMLPAFLGSFIHPSMRITIPDSYFELFAWMNEQPDTKRIAQLPIHSFWGWEYYDWAESDPDKLGFQGAGFLWFGIKQPLLHRDFDRWSIFNESYYREMSHAVYSQNPALFQQVLEKYHIGFIILDTSVIAPQPEQQVLFRDELAALLTKIPAVKKAKQFNSFLSVYTVESSSALAYGLSGAHPVATTSLTAPQDAAKTLLGEYYRPGPEDTTFSYVFPFSQLTRQDGQIHAEAFSLTNDGITLRVPSVSQENSVYQAQSLLDHISYLPADVFVKKVGATLRVSLIPYVFTATLPKTPLPLTATIPIPQPDENLLLNINRTQTFTLGNLPENVDILVGRVQLATKSQNTLSLYTTAPATVLSPDFSDLDYSLRQCETVKKEQLFAITNAGNGFELTAENTAVCMVIPFSELLKDISLGDEQELFLSSSFRIENADQTESVTSLCVANLQNGSCIDAQSSRLSLSPRVADFFTTAFSIRADALDSAGLRVFMDATKTDGPASVRYSEIRVEVFKPLYATSFAKETLSQSLPASPTLLQPSTAPLLLPFSGNKTFTTDITTLPRTSGACEQNPIVRRTNARKYISQEQNRFIRYEAKDSPMCDHFSYTNLPSDTGYMLLITARNLSGLPLSVCATNYYSKRCDVYARLDATESFSTQAFLLPPLGETQTGYDINISNLGIRGTPAVNDLASIDLVPLPYGWLSTLMNMPDDSPAPLRPERLPLQATHPLPHVYRISNASDSTLLTIPVGFEEGWQAYRTDSWLAQLLPFLFGEKIHHHVLVNSWENGWQLPDTTPQQAVISVVFLPQYLFYLGLILLALSLFSIRILTRSHQT